VNVKYYIDRIMDLIKSILSLLSTQSLVRNTSFMNYYEEGEHYMHRRLAPQQQQQQQQQHQLRNRPINKSIK
jgi:hypothetical protein